MNIFVLDEDPTKIAPQYHNKHVVKMVLETAQMLCSTHEPGSAPYKRTHYNHPCTIWARTTRANYRWLCRLGLCIANEYTKRYGKIHKSEAIIRWAQQNIPHQISKGPLTQWPQAMPKEYQRLNPIEGYKAYYADKLTTLGGS